MFYLLYHKLFEFGAFFFRIIFMGSIGCSTVCHYNFYTFHVEMSGFCAVVIRFAKKRTIFFLSVMTDHNEYQSRTGGSFVYFKL